MENLENQKLPEGKSENPEILQEIKLFDYERTKEDTEEWLVGQDIPDILWDRVKGVNPELTLGELLGKIKKELFDIYDTKRDHAKSFADSRFSSLSEMIERGMVSCGALANIFGNVLRKFKIPTKFVHGRYSYQTLEKENRHSWLEIYNPLDGAWVKIDPTKNDFKVLPETIQLRAYHNWQELREDYNKRDF